MRPPGAPLGEVAELVRLSGATSRRTHPVPPPPPQVLHAIEACRRAPLGGHAAHDPPWGFERYASNAWRHRPWPTCQTFPTGQWGADRPAAWRPGPAGPLVFPVPHALHPRLLAPQRPLFTLLGHAARHPRVPFGHRHRGGPIGCPRVRQPWAHPLGAHGHVHCRMAAGALAAASTRGMAADPRCLLPVRAVRPVCRGTFCEARRPGGATATTLRRQGLPALGTPADGKPLRAQLDAKDWVVSAKAPLAGPAPLSGTAGAALHAPSTQPQERGAVAARGHGDRPHPMSALGCQAPRTAPAAAPLASRCAPRRAPGAPALCRVIILGVMTPCDCERGATRSARTPGTAACRARLAPSRHGLAAARAPLLRHGREAPAPSSHLQAALPHDRRRLTRTVPHDTIPLRLYRLSRAAAQCNHVLSIMGDTMDKTLFVRPPYPLDWSWWWNVR
jgi:hypothetical protein